MKPLMFKVIKKDCVYWRVIFSLLGERCSVNVFSKEKAQMIFDALKN